MNRHDLLLIIEKARQVGRDYDAKANEGVMIRREHAAQLAERANSERDHGVLTVSEDFLDGYVAGFEKAAEIIRTGQIRSVK